MGPISDVTSASSGVAKAEGGSADATLLDSFSFDDGSLVYSHDGHRLLGVKELGPEVVSIRPAGDSGEIQLSSDGTLVDQLTAEGRRAIATAAVAMAVQVRRVAGDRWPTTLDEMGSAIQAFTADASIAAACAIGKPSAAQLVAFATTLMVLVSAVGGVATLFGAAEVAVFATWGVELGLLVGGFLVLKILFRAYRCYVSTSSVAPGRASTDGGCDFRTPDLKGGTLSATGLGAAPDLHGSLTELGGTACYNFHAPRDSEAPPLSPIFELARHQYTDANVELCAYAAGPPDVLDHIDGSWFCSDGEFQEAEGLTHELATVGCCLSTYAQTPWLQLMDLPLEINQLYASVARPEATAESLTEAADSSDLPDEAFTLTVRR